MIRPVNYRAESWRYIQTRLSWDKVTYNPNCPGRLAYESKLFEQPRLLVNTVVDLADEVEYLIDERAAHDIANHEALVILQRQADGQRKTVQAALVLNALKVGTVFEQL